MENIKGPAEEILDDFKKYIETSAELYKLQATEKSAEIATSVVINLTLAFLAGFVLLFASIALSLKLSEYFDHMYSGFLIVSAVYAIIAIFIITTKDKWLKNRIVDSIIKTIYSKKS